MKKINKIFATILILVGFIYLFKYKTIGFKIQLIAKPKNIGLIKLIIVQHISKILHILIISKIKYVISSNKRIFLSFKYLILFILYFGTKKGFILKTFFVYVLIFCWHFNL